MQALIKKYVIFAAYSVMIVVCFHLLFCRSRLFITMVMLKQDINEFSASANEELCHVCDLLQYDRRVVPSLPP